MDEETIANFCAVTNSEPRHAERYLAFSGGDLDTAVMMYFETGGQMPDDSTTATTATSIPSSSNGLPSAAGSGSPVIIPDEEDDEAMARRLAQEWSAGQEQVRAPIAPTRQVLQDTIPGSFDPYSMPPEFQNRFGPLSGAGGAGSSIRPQARGVFNQVAPSVWDGADEDAILRETTGGASTHSSKSSRLARLFQPPFDIMANIDLDTAREEARAETKWIMVNLQDNSDFASQTLNRDLWKDATVKATIKENFIFLQYTKESDDGQQYCQFYPFDKYPHIAILDPRTGERVKTWSEALKGLEFVSEVTEFLDRFSLDDSRQNPVQKKARQAAKPIDAMSEEEQMKAAIMASVGGSMEPVEIDDDEETDLETSEANGRTDIIDDSPFARISAVAGDEPAAGPTSTRIQLRMPASRTVRRFNLEDPVQRVFEYVKADVPEASNKRFKIVFNRVNLIDKLQNTIQEAGLKNASLVVELDE